MKKYIVKALAVSGKGNKIFRSGDEVNENQFPEGNAEKLVKSGHLIAAKVVETKPSVEELKTLTKAENEKRAEKAKADDEAAEKAKADAANAGGSTDKSFFNAKGETKVVKTIDDITTAELKAELTRLEVAFDAQSKKPVLFDLWMGL